jgi:hypothetical protein
MIRTGLLWVVMAVLVTAVFMGSAVLIDLLTHG